MPPNPTHNVSVVPSVLDGIELVEVRSEHTFPRHSHDQFGVGWMAAGAHRSWSGRGSVEAGPGDVITVNPNELHDGSPLGGPARSWHMMFIEPDTIGTLLDRETVGRELPSPVVTDPELLRSVTGTIEELRGGCSTVAGEMLVLLISSLLQDQRPRRSKTHRTDGVRRVLDCIHDAPDKTITLDELSDLTGLSRTGALRRFQREVGATPNAYAMQLRVRRARTMLTDDVPLAKIALATGFADQSHLTRAFRRQFGITPGRYRSAIAKGNIVQDAVL